MAASWRPWVPIHAIGALGLLFGAPGLPLGVLGVYFCGFKTFKACPGVRLSGTPFGTRFVVFLCPIWAPLASLLASLGCLLGGSWPLVRGPWEFLASFLVSLGSLRVSLESTLKPKQDVYQIRVWWDSLLLPFSCPERHIYRLILPTGAPSDQMMTCPV